MRNDWAAGGRCVSQAKLLCVHTGDPIDRSLVRGNALADNFADYGSRAKVIACKIQCGLLVKGNIARLKPP